MYLIVGLGNPGEEYRETRHNLGFKVVDELAARAKLSSLKNKCQSFIGETRINDQKVIIAKPQTFMNNSGQAVASLLQWYKIPPEKVILIYDDVDLEVGELRLRKKGGTAGHKGVASVLSSVGTPDFIRVRIGVGRETADPDISDYVLSKIPNDHLTFIQDAVEVAADSVLTVIKSGIDAAILELNRKSS